MGAFVPLDFAAGALEGASQVMDEEAAAVQELDVYKAKKVVETDELLRAEREKAKIKASENLTKNVAISQIISDVEGGLLEPSEGITSLTALGASPDLIEKARKANLAADPVLNAKSKKEQIDELSKFVDRDVAIRSVLGGGASPTGLTLFSQRQVDIAIEASDKDEEQLAVNNQAIIFLKEHPEVIGALSQGEDAIKSFFTQTKFSNELVNALGFTDIRAENRAKFTTMSINLLGRALNGITGDTRFTEGDVNRARQSLGDADSIFASPTKLLASLDTNRTQTLARLARTYGKLANQALNVTPRVQNINKTNPGFTDMYRATLTNPVRIPLGNLGPEGSQASTTPQRPKERILSVQEFRENYESAPKGTKFTIRASNGTLHTTTKK